MIATTALGRILTGVAAAAAIWTASGTIHQAHSQSAYCGQRQTMITALSKKFKEHRHGIGLVSNQRMIELYVSGRGSWTVLFTHPNGTSCIGATGKNWQALTPAEAPVPGAQSSWSGDGAEAMQRQTGSGRS